MAEPGPPRSSRPAEGGSDTPRPRLSVVIPCLDVAATLPHQLEALAGQQVDVPWEVVVADNGSRDATVEVAEEVAEGLAPRLPALRVVHEPRRGRHHACNAGAAAARGDLLVFVDGDDRVLPGFLAAMHRALEHHPVVAGRLEHRWQEGTEDLPRDPSGDGRSGPRAGDSARTSSRSDGTPATGDGDSPAATQAPRGFGRVQTDGLRQGAGFLPAASGGCLGVHREAFLEVGGFHDGPAYGEDVDLSWRLQLAGHAIAFEPAAAVAVRQRGTLRDMYRQHRNFGQAWAHLYRLYQHRGMPRRPLARAAEDWWKIVRGALRARSDDEKARWVRRLGRAVGRLRGSVRHRVLYL